MIMTRTLSSSIILLRQISAGAQQNPKGQVRNLTGETKGGDFGSKNSEINAVNDQLPNKDQDFTDIAREICKITRTKTGWEQTLLSEYPSFNFSNPCFFQAFLKHQNNALLSLRFFNWLCSYCGFAPDQPSCNVLFGALVDAKACNAAKSLLDCTGFTPEPASLECYIRSLSDSGMVEEALIVFSKLKNIGFCPSIETWNASLLGCLKTGRTDLLWALYEQMIDSGATANIDVKTVEHLVQAFCKDNKVWEGYGLLRQVMEDGLLPDNAVFNSLISGFSTKGEYARVSELLHIMITKKYTLSISTYQEIINGLMKNKKHVASLWVFNDLKDRGYFPDRVMYTTMIKGLIDQGWLGEARKLWFEMIQKGFLPNEYTYNVMIYGYCKRGNFSKAWRLYEEMCNQGYRETTVSYNTMISGLCLHGRTDEAQRLFEEMSQKGVVRDLITYNSLIQGLCKKGKLVEATKLFSRLLAEGLKPLTSSFTPLIKTFCQVGDLQAAIRLWKDMHDWHLEPTKSTHDHIIIGLCEKGCFMEGLEWMMEMLSKKLKPQQKSFKSLIQCLSQKDRLGKQTNKFSCFNVQNLAAKIANATVMWHEEKIVFCKSNGFYNRITYLLHEKPNRPFHWDLNLSLLSGASTVQTRAYPFGLGEMQIYHFLKEQTLEHCRQSINSPDSCVRSTFNMKGKTSDEKRKEARGKEDGIEGKGDKGKGGHEGGEGDWQRRWGMASDVQIAVDCWKFQVLCESLWKIYELGSTPCRCGLVLSPDIRLDTLALLQFRECYLVAYAIG